MPLASIWFCRTVPGCYLPPGGKGVSVWWPYQSENDTGTLKPLWMKWLQSPGRFCWAPCWFWERQPELATLHDAFMTFIENQCSISYQSELCNCLINLKANETLWAMKTWVEIKYKLSFSWLFHQSYLQSHFSIMGNNRKQNQSF